MTGIDLVTGAPLGTLTYFIQSVDGGPIKIGRSTKAALLGRLGSIQTGNPERLRVTHTLRGDQERALHWRFRHLRLEGEWFLPDPELVAFARAMLPLSPGWDAKRAYREGYVEGWKASLARSHDDLQEHIGRAVEVVQRIVKDDLALGLADAELFADEHRQRSERDHQAERIAPTVLRAVG